MLTIQTLVGFAEKAKVNTLAAERVGASAHHANLTSVEDYDYYDEDMDESANAHQAHNELTPEAMTEKKFWTMMMTRKTDTFSSYVALDDVTVFEAAELDANALLAHTLERRS